MDTSYSKTKSWRYLIREYKSLSLSERKRVLERYENKCATCGYHCGLEVHHIDGETLEPALAQYNADSNLICLCSKCHNAFTSLELKYPKLYWTMAHPYLRKLVR